MSPLNRVSRRLTCRKARISVLSWTERWSVLCVIGPGSKKSRHQPSCRGRFWTAMIPGLERIEEPLFSPSANEKALVLRQRHPRYVTSIDAGTNTIRIGKQDDLLASEVLASSANWIAFESPPLGICAGAQMRYRHDAAPGIILQVENNRIRFRFDRPQRALTPGQSLVLYDGDLVLGGGIIDKALP